MRSPARYMAFSVEFVGEVQQFFGFWAVRPDGLRSE